MKRAASCANFARPRLGILLPSGEVKAFLYYGLNTLEWLYWKDFHCLVNSRLNEWHAVPLTAEREPNC